VPRRVKGRFVNFAEDDIVVISDYPVAEAIGRDARVLIVDPGPCGSETWYGLVDVGGKPRIAAHSWLRPRGWDELWSMVGIATTEA
jgi:hypothetical protein